MANDFYFDESHEFQTDLNIGMEMKAYVLLLQNPNGKISSDDFVLVGDKRNTANVFLKRLVEKGSFKECGNVGSVKYYTSVMPIEKLRSIFTGKESDVDE